MAEILEFRAPAPLAVPDAEARAQALDITRSFLVEAPAGSGKTGLLIQRFLKLLASDSVSEPSQVLAITFTRKATTEMLERVLAQLSAAFNEQEPKDAFDRATRPLAEAVLARDAQLGWNLLDHPGRFNIRTIDALSNQIASALPVLSGAGGAQVPTENAGQLYTEAARRTLLQLADPTLHAALVDLLLHRDGNLANCEALIASILKTREQWGELIPLNRAAMNDAYLDDTVLPSLDRALDLAICRSLTRLTQLLEPAILERLCALAAEMGSLDGYKESPSPIAICAGNIRSPQARAVHLDHWRALIHLLVKPSKPRDWRKSVSGNYIGFGILKHQQAELKQIVAELSSVPGLLEALCQIEALPPAEYPRQHWPLTKSLFRVLARALAELKVLFAERGQSDFTEIALLAREALRFDSASDDLSSSGLRLQHLLVDEMQDTSTGQYEFIQLLTRRWDGHSQTVFLVGDPKQSIYLFRQARVERFVRTLLDQRLGDLPLTTLRLTANFRSEPRLVAAFNADFSQIFPSAPDATQPELVPFQSAFAVRSGIGQRTWHANPIDYASDPAAAQATALHHAAEIRNLLIAFRAEHPGKTAAILVRNRSHLSHIVAALREPEAIPFRAVDIEPLGERPEILDLLALTRALLHPADRTAWLALLRSPACGLSLADLHRLASATTRADSEQTLFQLFSTRGAELSDDGIARLQPFWLTLDAALKQRGHAPLSQWIERTWRALGFPTCASPDALTNSERFFHLLDDASAHSEPGAPLSLTRLQQQVTALYAAPSTAPDAVDLMTLHKAKGLEWDLVIVPELHRAGRNNTGELLEWLESNPDDASDDTIAAGILAPISSKGRATHQLNAWMRSIFNAREAAERKRLFYVACTRARQSLHLFAAPRRKKDGGVTFPSGSLLHAAWPAAEPFFDRQNTPFIVQLPQPLSLAAVAEPRVLERLPAATCHPPAITTPGPIRPSFTRPEGSFSARAFGNTMHTFLEQLSRRIAGGAAPAQLLSECPSWSPRINAVLRASGLPPAELDRLTAGVLRGLTATLGHAEGQWILAAHPGAVSESSLTTWRGSPSTIRLDRTFLAGPAPLAPGTSHLWIVDYKTATHGSAGLEVFLEKERHKYAAQLETYARELAPTLPVRLALYYPMLPHLLWWDPLEPAAL